MSTVDGVEITGPMGPRFDEILTPQALGLIALLHRELNGRRLERLQARQERVQALSDGGTLDFLPETAAIREDDSWRGAPPAPRPGAPRAAQSRPPPPPRELHRP